MLVFNWRIFTMFLLMLVCRMLLTLASPIDRSHWSWFHCVWRSDFATSSTSLAETSEATAWRSCLLWQGPDMITLLETNISPPMVCFKMIFLFPRWYMLVLWNCSLGVLPRAGEKGLKFPKLRKLDCRLPEAVWISDCASPKRLELVKLLAHPWLVVHICRYIRNAPKWSMEISKPSM